MRAAPDGQDDRAAQGDRVWTERAAPGGLAARAARDEPEDEAQATKAAEAQEARQDETAAQAAAARHLAAPVWQAQAVPPRPRRPPARQELHQAGGEARRREDQSGPGSPLRGA